MTLPFTGGIDSLENGTLILAVAFALLHLAYGSGSSARRTVAAAAPAALLAVLCLVLPGPALLALAFAAAAAGEILLSLDRPRFAMAARAAFGLALALVLWLLGHAFAGGVVPAGRLAFAVAAGLVLLAGILPVLAARMPFAETPSSRPAVALRHAGLLALGLAVLA